MLTREQYLHNSGERINALVFAPIGETATNVRYSIGFPGGGSARKRIGECWSPDASGDQTIEIFISPVVVHDLLLMLATQVHEMVHAIVGNDCGHKGAFRKLALAAGLEGKMTATVAGERLAAILKSILDELGEFPGKELSLNERKKQTTRLIKVGCPDCSNVARQSRTQYELHGLICGACCVPMRAV